jgi:hypothetical protein
MTFPDTLKISQERNLYLFLCIRFTIVFSEKIISVSKQNGRKVPGTITTIFRSKREGPNSGRYLP